MAGRSYHFMVPSSDPSEDEEETDEGENAACSVSSERKEEEKKEQGGEVGRGAGGAGAAEQRMHGEAGAFSASHTQSRFHQGNIQIQHGFMSKGTKEKFHIPTPEEPGPAHFRKNEDWQQNFIQVLLLEKPQLRGLNFLLEESWRQDEVEEAGHLIDIRDLFGPGPGSQEEPQTVVLYGPAGIGKSTLAKQVKGAWEGGWLYRDHFQHMVFINCRELDKHKLRSVKELIMKDSCVPLTSPQHLLFILDDVDELQLAAEEMESYPCEHWREPQSLRTLVCSLLRRSSLPEASLLITARATALQKLMPFLKQARWVEVLGFSEPSREEYFYRHFSEERQARVAFSLVELNPALFTLCQAPWVSWLVCTCLQQQIEWGEQGPLTPQTTTALCLHYLVQTLPAQLLGTQLRRLCSLAAEGIRESKTLFSVGELSRCGLDGTIILIFLEINVLQKHDQAQSYSFTHSCFHAFFAAMSFILAYEESSHSPGHVADMIRLIQGYKSHLLMPQTISFLFGLLSEPVVDMLEKIFTCKLRRLSLWTVWDWIQPEAPLQQPYSVEMFCFLYESQSKQLLSSVLADVKETRMHIQTDVELLVITFCLKFCRQVKRLRLSEGRHREEAQRPSGVVLSVRAPLTDMSWKVFLSTLKGSEELRELDLRGNLLTPTVVKNLCETLRSPHCPLQTLRLARCGLTPSCCWYLATALCTSSSLKNLDLRQNDLGDHGVKLLCQGLRLPSCHLLFLCLDLDPLSEAVKKELSTLKERKLELIISSSWKPSVMSPPEGPVAARIVYLSKRLSPSPDNLKKKHVGRNYDFRGPAGPVTVEMLGKGRNLFRAPFPAAGSYHCPSMGLSFVVRRAVTINIEFCSWDKFLDKTSRQDSWMVAGPLFDITAEQEAVAAVHLPHFVALQGEHVDTSQFLVAHFTEEGMLLEKPARVEPHCVVLENPSFSPVGVLLRLIPKARRFIRITSTTLLYHQQHPEDLTFHLYLVPDDCTIQKAIDDTEEKFRFVRIHKPPPQDPLYLDSRYTVSGSESLEVIPQELKFCYRSPEESQLFSEIFVANLDSEIKLQISVKKDGTLVWETKVKPGDLSSAANVIMPGAAEAPALLHFVDRHREQLVNRVVSVDPVLDLLHGQVLSEEQYEQVRAEATRPDQMRKLFSFSRAWDWSCKERFYRALKETHPHLIMELWEKN